MQAIVNVVIPVFLIVAIGYGARRFDILGDTASKIINDFVYYIALPALLFVLLAELKPGSLLRGDFLIAHYGSMLGVFGLTTLALAFVSRARFAIAALHGLSGCFANVGYMGVPLFLAAYGEAGLLPAAIAMAIHASVINSLAVVLVELDVGGGKNFLGVAWGVLVSILRSPLVIAPGLGLGIALLGLELPAPIRATGKLIGAAAGPCALFAMGLFMVGQKLAGDRREIAYLTVIKLLVHPAIAWLLAYRVLDMEPFWAHSAVLLAALPTGATLFTVAQNYGIYVRRALGVTLASTALGVLSISGWVLLLGEVRPG
jgi:malonate transporter and related proteins